MVCQLRPLVYSLGLNNPPRICLTPRKSRVKTLWRNKQENCRCKMAGAGIQSLAKFRAQMCATDCGNPRRLELGLPIIPSRGWPQAEVWIWERIATGLTWPRQPERGTWQSAVHLRAVCQEVIHVLAIRGIWPRNLANDRIPAPAILHRETPCLKRHIFLPRDF
jgi:hypothetical protein